MNLPDDEQGFLRALVKAARQKTHVVTWTDRDGTERVTALSAAEATRLNALAHRLGLSKPALMRQAAHLPVARAHAAPVPPETSTGV
jgi:hypothetical protein